MQEKPYTTRDHVRTTGKSLSARHAPPEFSGILRRMDHALDSLGSSMVAECPFCAASVVIFLWSIIGNGKKLCACGAALHSDQSRASWSSCRSIPTTTANLPVTRMASPGT